MKPKFFSEWLNEGRHPPELKYSSLEKMRRMYSEYYCMSFGTFEGLTYSLSALTNDEFKDMSGLRNSIFTKLQHDNDIWQSTTIHEFP